MDTIIDIAVTVVLLELAALAVWLYFRFRRSDAYIYVPKGTVLAEWQYKQLPMKECAYCHHKVNLNRHHLQPWAASPELKDDPNNLVVLCRSCHQSVAHGNNWKRFNSNLAETLKTPVWVDSNEYYKDTHGGSERTEKRK